MNRQTKRLLAKQEKQAERERVRQAAAGGGRGGRRDAGGGRGGGVGGRGRGDGAGGPGRVPATKERRLKRWLRFLREVRQELKKVAWPTRSEVATYTVVVLISVTFVTLLVFGLDYVFGEGAFSLFST